MNALQCCCFPLILVVSLTSRLALVRVGRRLSGVWLLNLTERERNLHTVIIEMKLLGWIDSPTSYILGLLCFSSSCTLRRVIQQQYYIEILKEERNQSKFKPNTTRLFGASQQNTLPLAVSLFVRQPQESNVASYI